MRLPDGCATWSTHRRKFIPNLNPKYPLATVSGLGVRHFEALLQTSFPDSEGGAKAWYQKQIAMLRHLEIATLVGIF